MAFVIILNIIAVLFLTIIMWAIILHFWPNKKDTLCGVGLILTGVVFALLTSGCFNGIFISWATFLPFLAATAFFGGITFLLIVHGVHKLQNGT